ncbi:uncharacterized protein TRIADDRAFT_27805, partial [Trichoplax adhaerens]
VNIRIHEARQLSGININPVVHVTVGSDKKKTNVKEATNCPLYNEFFVFDYQIPHALVMEKMILLEVNSTGGKLSLKSHSLVGMYKLDIQTVYNAPDHQFYRKWAYLTDPHDHTNSCKGYLKVDIAVIARGTSISTPGKVKNEDDIDSNLLSPDGGSADRARANYKFNIYYADGLPQMDSGILPNIKRVITRGEKELTDAYVEVNFFGHSVKTPVKRHTYKPIWNECICITDLFPPLCATAKVQIKDSDAVATDVPIATHVIEMSKISYNKLSKGFLPTYGPTSIYLYGSTRDFSMFDENIKLNQGEGEGAAYRGRLVISLTVHLCETHHGSVACGNKVSSIPALPKVVINNTLLGKQERFLLFALLSECSMINKKYSDKPVELELTMGNYGNEIDFNASDDAHTVVSTAEEHHGSEHILYHHATTHPMLPDSFDDTYFFIPWENTKPCLYIQSKWLAHLYRIYLANMIDKIRHSLLCGLVEIEDLAKHKDARTIDYFRAVLDELIAGCNQVVIMLKNESISHRLGITDLDIARMKLCSREMIVVSNLAYEISKRSDTLVYIKGKLASFHQVVERLTNLVDTPQQALPDVFLWMIAGGKRIAYARIPAADIIHSELECQRGIDCGKMTSFFLRVPGKKGYGFNENTVQARVRLMLWLGLQSHKKDYVRGIPKGYKLTNKLKNADEFSLVPPKSVKYIEEHKFELRAYLYQARSLAACDKSGFSDPFARIMYSNITVETRIIRETLSPIWDETIRMRSIVLYGTLEDIVKSPGTIVIDVFDNDLVGSSEFLGRTVAKPNVKILSEEYVKPKFPSTLRWYSLYKGGIEAGAILAAFELFEVKFGMDFDYLPPLPLAVTRNEIEKVIPVPSGIRPVLSKFRIQVLFWGVRDMRKLQLQAVVHPQIEIECGGQVVQSEICSNAKKNPNFTNVVASLDVEVPENTLFWAPIAVRVKDYRNFGRFYLVGSCEIDNFDRFWYKRRKKGAGSLFANQSSINIQMSNKIHPALADSKSTTDLDKAQSVSSIPGAHIKRSAPSQATKKSQAEHEKIDWWSKYYASQNTFSDVDRKKFTNVDTLKIYDSELENQPEFGGFKDVIQSFALYRGKRDNNADDNAKIVGCFKGNLKICRLPLPQCVIENSTNGMFTDVPASKPTSVLVRIYIIKANNLHPTDINGKADPYLIVSLGKTKINDRENYISKNLSPIFGRAFHIEATIPLETTLTVQVYDMDMIGSDDLIGETKIDIENRFYSKHRPSCGLPITYSEIGYNKWRDPLKPTQILNRLCKEEKLDGPYYADGEVSIGKCIITGPTELIDSRGRLVITDEHVALKALHQWHKISGRGMKLVPEHIETRPLYNPGRPGIEQGNLEMWVDVFPMDIPIPEDHVDISPRKPARYELRVVIWNTEDVICNDHNMLSGEQMSDIYVKCWIKGHENNKQSTDIHHKSYTGEGNFNWRMIFEFDYLAAEEKVVVKKKEHFYSLDETEHYEPFNLIVQVWDADMFSSDDFTGMTTFDLLDMPRGVKEAAHCELNMLKSDNHPRFDLMKQKSARGWFPVVAQNHKSEDILAGKVEIELTLLTEDEAKHRPAGLKREAPEPLPKPNRPEDAVGWFSSPFKACKFGVCRNYKRDLFILFLVFLLFMFAATFVYAIPVSYCLTDHLYYYYDKYYQLIRIM